MTLHFAHTIQPPREPKWYADPVTGVQHAFVGIRTACNVTWWTATWSIIGPIEAVDRGMACANCIALTNSTEAELSLDGGDR